MKIAVVGDTGVDYYQNLKLRKPGGIAFNFAYHLKKNKVSNVSLVSVLGDDDYSEKLFTLLKKLKIDSSHVSLLPGKCAWQNIFLKNNGERNFTGYDGGILKKWSLNQKDLDFVKKHRAVFVPLSDDMEHIFEAIIKIKDIIKVTDFSQDYIHADFEKKNNVITRYAKYFDIIFIGGNKKHKKMITELSLRFPEKVFILTLGSEGSIAFYRKESYFQPSEKINKIVDTTGCGDAFQAGFLSAWFDSLNMAKSLKAGNNSAAKVIITVGSTPLTL